MKLFRSAALVAALCMGLVASALSQTYPTTNPTYIPSAVLTPVALAAPGNVVYAAQGLGTVTLRVTGTCTSLAGTVQGSNDGGTNYTSIPITPISAGASVPSGAISAVGFWRANAAGMNRIRVNVTALAASCTFALSGSPATTVADQITGDPCDVPTVQKSSVAVAISTATTTQLVALSAGKTIYFCGFVGSMGGTTPAVTFEYGTGSNCATGTVVLTGAIAPTSGSILLMPIGSSTWFQTASANALCALSAGTTPSIQGVLTYVQQ